MTSSVGQQLQYSVQESQQLHDTAAKALLSMIDNRTTPIKGTGQRDAALKTLLEEQQLNRLTKAGLVKAYDMQTITKVAYNLCKHSTGRIAALFELGSSIVDANYLTRLGYERTVNSNPSAVVDANDLTETHFDVCEWVILNVAHVSNANDNPARSSGMKDAQRTNHSTSREVER